jgi:MurNAc alpha-1-phosphate uridylyltransferase
MMPTVLILAAGKGQRMLPLTQATPKPLLKVAGVSLLDHHLVRLNQSLVEGESCRVIINVAHMGQQIIDHIEQTDYANLEIIISDERNCDALETAGGIVNALPLIESDYLMVINGDIYTDLNFFGFWKSAQKALAIKDAYVGLVQNPDHNSDGDFYLDNSSEVHDSLKTDSVDPVSTSSTKLTFAGVSAYRTSIFRNLSSGPRALAPLLREAMAKNRVSGELLNAQWIDVGTPQRLSELNTRLSGQS